MAKRASPDAVRGGKKLVSVAVYLRPPASGDEDGLALASGTLTGDDDAERRCTAAGTTAAAAAAALLSSCSSSSLLAALTSSPRNVNTLYCRLSAVIAACKQQIWTTVVFIPVANFFYRCRILSPCLRSSYTGVQTQLCHTSQDS